MTSNRNSLNSVSTIPGQYQVRGQVKAAAVPGKISRRRSKYYNVLGEMQGVKWKSQGSGGRGRGKTECQRSEVREKKNRET